MRLARALTALLTVAGAAAAQTPLAELADRLGAADARARSAAYRELMSRRAPELIDLIGARIEGYPQNGRHLAINLLRMFPEPEREAVHERLLRSQQPLLRAFAAAALARRAAADRDDKRRRRHVDVLVTALEACPPDERVTALHQTYGVDDDRVTERIRAFLESTAPRHLVTTVLQDLGRRERPVTDATRAAARRALASADLHTRATVLAFLARDGGADADVDALVKLLADHPEVTWTARDQLADVARLDERLVEALLDGLRRVDATHHIARTVDVLRRHARDRVAAVLRELLSHEKDDLRDEALAQLAKMPGGLREKDLAEMLRSDSPAAQLVAAEALRRRDDRSGLDAALAAAKRPGRHRADAARVLGDFRAPAAVPVLLDLLDDPDRGVRGQAWGGLQKTLRALYPFRDFRFETAGYDPSAASRAGGIATLRGWWQQAR